MSFDAFITAIALMSDLRAVYPGTCLSCGGPIAPGDKVVPVDKAPWAPSGAQHRSCLFMPRGEVFRFRYRRTVRPQSEPVDPRQVSLFEQPAVITKSSQIQPDAHGLAASGDRQDQDQERPGAAEDENQHAS